MAELNPCVYCGQLMPADHLYCSECGGNQDEVVRPPVAPTPAPVRAPVTGATPRPAACGECAAPVGDAPVCRYCGSPTPAASHEPSTGTSASLVLPDGTEIDVGAEPTVLGRDEDDSPVAAALENYGNVSRRHAMVICDRDDLRVTDLASTNGTFVNDVKLAPHRSSSPLADGDLLRLGADCVLRVALPVAASPGHSR